MKKLIMYCLAILFASQLMAQNGRNSNETRGKRFFKHYSSAINYQMKVNSLMNKKAISEKLDSTVYEYDDNGQWNIERYSTYQVNADGIFVSSAFYSWNENEMRFNQAKEEFTYDGNGRLTIVSDSYYSFDNDFWITDRKQEKEYNADGEITKITYSNWDSNGNKWNEYSKDEYEYDGNKNMVKLTGFSWDNNAWSATYKEENEYNGNNKQTKSNSFNWNQGMNDWVNSNKTEISYNNDGHISASVSLGWDENTDQWVNQSRETYSYDANKNLKEGLFGNWDEMENKWVDDEKAELSFDLNVAITDILLPSDILSGVDIHINNKLLALNYSVLDGGNWVIDSKETYYYSSFTTSGINKTNVATTKVYPNPAKDVVNFDLSNMPYANEIIVFDMNGKQVLNHSITNGNQIDISQLNKGLYMYKIIGNDNISSGKLIIE